MSPKIGIATVAKIALLEAAFFFFFFCFVTITTTNPYRIIGRACMFPALFFFKVECGCCKSSSDMTASCQYQKKIAKTRRKRQK